MDLKDISYLGIVDSSGRVLYEINYCNVNAMELMKNRHVPISIYKDKPLFIETKISNKGHGDLHFILLAEQHSNEIFVYEAFQSLLEIFDKFMKNGWHLERFETKYDMFILAINEFVFNGIILEDNKEKLTERLQKRSFESIGGIKVNKGLASMLNKAAKSMKNSFSLKK